MLEVSHLSKRFGSIQALDSLSLTVGDNELVGFVGANGAGKSTTMRIISSWACSPPTPAR